MGYPWWRWWVTANSPKGQVQRSRGQALVFATQVPRSVQLAPQGLPVAAVALPVAPQPGPVVAEVGLPNWAELQPQGAVVLQG